MPALLVHRSAPSARCPRTGGSPARLVTANAPGGVLRAQRWCVKVYQHACRHGVRIDGNMIFFAVQPAHRNTQLLPAMYTGILVQWTAHEPCHFFVNGKQDTKQQAHNKMLAQIRSTFAFSHHQFRQITCCDSRRAAHKGTQVTLLAHEFYRHKLRNAPARPRCLALCPNCA